MEKTAESRITVYLNGDILTMNDKQPTADALAIRDGKIIAVGHQSEVASLVGSNVEIKNLNGKTLLPGFIDSHGHLSHLASFSEAGGFDNISPPPVGTVRNISDIQQILLARKAEVAPGEWIIGMGYDDSLIEENRHPTRQDLDEVSVDQPVALWHISGHLLVCNSKCLELMGISSKTKNMKGGVIRRMPNSDIPNGILEEKYTLEFLKLLPEKDTAKQFFLLEKAQEYIASYGITTVQDGASFPSDLQLLRQASRQGRLWLDVVAYVFYPHVAVLNDEFPFSQEYQSHFRVGGIKLILDGSPQGKTAWLTEPYYRPPEGRSEDYGGYPILDDVDVVNYMDEFITRKIPILAHANGDAAADQLIKAVKTVNRRLGGTDHRTTMIHAQTVREDQIEDMQYEGIIPSYFASHTFFWGDWHRDSVLGAKRAARISPLASTLKRNIPFTIHNDAPVVPPDMMRLVWSAVNRVTRSGQILGEEQRISPYDALKAITINAAYQYFEEASKGSIKVGKLADFVVLSENPLTVDPMKIKDLKVIETIKEGVTVFTAP